MISYVRINETYKVQLQSIWSDPMVIKYTNILNPCSLDDIESRIDRFKTQEVFVVLEDNELIGVIGCPCIDTRNTQFGLFYQFKQSVWGHGYARVASNWLLKYMNKYVNANIYADVITENIASEKILVAHGFRLVSETNAVHNYELLI